MDEYQEQLDALWNRLQDSLKKANTILELPPTMVSQETFEGLSDVFQEMSEVTKMLAMVQATLK